MAFLKSFTSSALALSVIGFAPLAAQDTEPAKKGSIIEIRPNEELAASAAEVPYLGVGSSPINDLLAGHLQLNHGVVVQKVHETSGAKEAGLQKDDILLTFDGVEIRGPIDLRDAVVVKSVGEEVEVEILRRGEKQTLAVTLTERPEGLPRFSPQGSRQLGQMEQVFPHPGLRKRLGTDPMRQLEEMVEQFDELSLGLKMNDLLDQQSLDSSEPLDIDLGTQSSVTWADAAGNITMKMRNGETTVAVHNEKGEVLYEGPWNTEDEKAAVDPKIRERIEKMGVSSKGSGLRFLMGR